MSKQTQTPTPTPEPKPLVAAVPKPDKYTPAYVMARYGQVSAWLDEQKELEEGEQHKGFRHISAPYGDLLDSSLDDNGRKHAASYLSMSLTRFKLEDLEVKRVHSNDPNKVQYETQVHAEAASCFTAEASDIVASAKPIRSSSKKDAPTASNLDAEVSALAGRLAHNAPFNKNTDYATTHYRTGEPLATEEDEPTEELTLEE